MISTQLRFIFRGDFDWKKFLGDNKAFWIWSISMVLLLLMVVTIEPTIATSIKTLIGLDIANEPASFFSLGWALALAANGAVKKKLDKKLNNNAKTN